MSESPNGPEVWGGVECTVNRVHETFYDQQVLSGHRHRVPEDLALFSAIGIKALRVGLPWEVFAATRSWDFADTILPAMAERGMRPILGLLHHGSGPMSTNLLDPAFPEKLATYAGQVAGRYPHILDYTPVNEPQTTGRFSCLYGHWYPHHRSMESYLRALLNQVKGIVLSMRAIRAVQPDARLIHTEDSGATFSTPALESFRVAREHRRWLGVDLLCGRVTQTHPLFGFLLEHGFSGAEVLWFAENPCPPSVLGLNYYVTSDRYLDHRLELYPGRAGGDTGVEPLVDIEAVRVRAAGISGVGAILREAWDRYGLPLAITEAHLGADPAEQVRWLAEVWTAAQAASGEGIDVRAVAPWALLGSFNWNHLCTIDDGSYEPGVFSLATGRPLATPLASLVYRMSQALPLDAYTSNAGWWRKPDRLTLPPFQESPETSPETLPEAV